MVSILLQQRKLKISKVKQSERIYQALAWVITHCNFAGLLNYNLNLLRMEVREKLLHLWSTEVCPWLPVSPRLPAVLVHYMPEVPDNVMHPHLRGGEVVVQLWVLCDCVLRKQDSMVTIMSHVKCPQLVLSEYGLSLQMAQAHKRCSKMVLGLFIAQGVLWLKNIRDY